MVIPDIDGSVSAAGDAAGSPFVKSQPALSRSTRVLRPTGATVVGVLCTIMGILCTLGSLLALLNVLFAAQFASLFNQGGAFQEAQAELNEAMATVLAKYFIPNLLLSISGILLGTLLASGAVGLLVGRGWSRKLLRRTLLLLIVYEIIRAVVYGFTQFEIVPITQQYMEEVAGGANAPGGREFVAQLSAIMMVVGIVIWSVWTLVKLALMVWGRRYIGSSKLDDYFAAQA